MTHNLKMTWSQEYDLRRFFWHSLMKKADFEELRIYVALLHFAALIRFEQEYGETLIDYAKRSLPAEELVKLANRTDDFDPERASVTRFRSSLTRFPYRAYAHWDHVQIAKARAIDAIVHTLALLPADELEEILTLAGRLAPVQSYEMSLRRRKRLLSRLRDILAGHVRGALANVPQSRIVEFKKLMLDGLLPCGASSQDQPVVHMALTRT